MKRVIAALVLVVLGAACRDSALGSDNGRDANVAICAAAHGIPHILLAYHADRIGMKKAVEELYAIRDLIDDNAAGPHKRELHDLAAAVRVFALVTKHRGDTNDAYRDLRALRETMPPCRSKRALKEVRTHVLKR